MNRSVTEKVLSQDAAKDCMDENSIAVISGLARDRITHLKEMTGNNRQDITMEDEAKEDITL